MDVQSSTCTTMERPRTPNDQYTVMTDEQIGNIRQMASTFFDHKQVRHDKPLYVGPPREGGRYYMNRYATTMSGHSLRNLNTIQPHCWIDEQWRRELPELHNCSRGMASVKWGPQKVGERIRSHFFGENIERYTTIDMYRRPATNHSGRVVMDCGRPGDGYYTQKYPSRTTWFETTAPVNNKPVLQSVYRKTFEEYECVEAAEVLARRARTNQWPEYTEYTDKYLLHTHIPQEPSAFEKTKRHALLGQRIQAEEMAMKETERIMAEESRVMMEKSREVEQKNDPNINPEAACHALPIVI